MSSLMDEEPQVAQFGGMLVCSSVGLATKPNARDSSPFNLVSLVRRYLQGAAELD